jgi:anti-anti-sigma factor
MYSSSTRFRAAPGNPPDGATGGVPYTGIPVGGSMQEGAATFLMREASPTALVLTCQGGLSWEERDVLAHQVNEYLQQRPSVIGLVADMADVDFVNSAGLGALFQLNRRLRDRGGRIVFANVPPQLLRVFRAVGLDRLAGVEGSVEAALQLLTEPTSYTPIEESAPNSPPPV